MAYQIGLLEIYFSLKLNKMVMCSSKRKINSALLLIRFFVSHYFTACKHAGDNICSFAVILFFASRAFIEVIIYAHLRSYATC